MILADRIAAYFAANGCTHSFGCLGDANRTIMDAISKRMTLVTMRHEKTCALASIHHYRVCGRIAPCIVTGDANALAGVSQAHIDGVPLLIISSNEDNWSNTLAAATPISKAAMRPDNALGASFALEGLYKLALSPPQGPVWFDLPDDLAAKEPSDGIALT